MDKVEVYVDVEEKEIMPFKITINGESVQEIDVCENDSDRLDFLILKPYIGQTIDLVYCTDCGATPMFVSDNRLINIVQDDYGYSLLQFNDQLSVGSRE